MHRHEDMDKIGHLRREIAQREAELVQLRAQLDEAEKLSAADEKDVKTEWKWPLEEHDYERYSRQMIVPNFGLQGIYFIQLLTHILFSAHMRTNARLT